MSGDRSKAIEIGTAAELLVCADCFLAGHRAFQSSQGLPYDVILDVKGTLFRVGVKSTWAAKPRPAREGSRVCYQFGATRNSRDRRGQTVARAYTDSDIDIMAFVALDIRAIAYVPVIGKLVTSWHIDAPGHDHRTPGKWGPKITFRRKRFGDFPLSAAVEAAAAHRSQREAA